MKCTSFVSDFAHHAVRNRPSVPSEGRFEGIEIEKVFTAVGLGGAAQPRPARRGMLSRDLFESPSGARSRGSSAENGRGNGLEGITHEKSMAEDDKNAPLKNLPYSFPGFGPRDSGEQQQIPFPPSLPPYWKEVQEAMMTIRKMYVEVRSIGRDRGKKRRKEEKEEINPPVKVRSHQSFSCRASNNSLSSLGPTYSQLLPIRIFATRSERESTACHPQASPPFNSPSHMPLRHHKSKGTSTRESHETRSTGNVVSRTTESGGDGRTPEMWNKDAGGTEHYAPPHTRGFMYSCLTDLNWNGPFPFYISVL